MRDKVTLLIALPVSLKIRRTKLAYPRTFKQDSARMHAIRRMKFNAINNNTHNRSHQLAINALNGAGGAPEDVMFYKHNLLG